MDKATIIALCSLLIGPIGVVLTSAYIYGRMTVKMENFRTGIDEAKQLAKIEADTISKQMAGEITHLIGEVDEVKRQCDIFRNTCKVDTCQRIDRLAAALSDDIKELKADITRQLENGAKKFEKFTLHMGQAIQFMHTMNGKTKDIVDKEEDNA